MKLSKIEAVILVVMFLIVVWLMRSISQRVINIESILFAAHLEKEVESESKKDGI